MKETDRAPLIGFMILCASLVMICHIVVTAQIEKAKLQIQEKKQK